MSQFVAGLIAGAAGTTALNVASYLDMLIRARPASSMPAEVAGTLSQKAGISLEDGLEQEHAQYRKEGLGAILGIANGLLIGGAFGLIHSVAGRPPTLISSIALGALAMAASDLPATSLGKTDPRSWPASSWIADIVPHLVYGIVTALTLEAVTNRKSHKSALQQFAERLR
ncbi:MAG: hypothetical protein ACKVVP_01790 [Chloroflexota bacterium]